MNKRSDNELLRDYAEQGSESAFEQLVRRHIDLVYSVALRMVVDSQFAEDVTQTTFAVLAQEARHLIGRVYLSSWLHRTASNQSAKLVRGEMRRRAREHEFFAMRTEPSESEPSWKQITPLLDTALNKLSESDRAVILLRFFEKKSAGEIGASLKVTEEAAQKRVWRALDRLRGLLADRGAVLTTTTLTTLITEEFIVAAPSGLAASIAPALAGGAIGSGISLGTLKIIVMSKFKLGAVSAVVVAGFATPLVLQHQSLNHLRAEVDSLNRQAAQTATLQDENNRLATALAAAKQASTLPKAQLSELLRLRGEVGPLRQDSQELARLRAVQAAQEKKTAGGKPSFDYQYTADFVPSAAWANVGIDKPENAIQTFFWAAKHGETNLVGNLIRWQRDAAIPESQELDEMFTKSMIGGATLYSGSLQAFRVNSFREEGDDLVRLDMELTDQDGKTGTHSLRLVQEDGRWFPVMNVWLQDKGSIRAALDVPPKFAPAK